ncbi:hypothetical protein BGZ93_003206 [Podila epicladia]|nr:hypothetical protein BGZ92_004524 [Podila epicladia]KAG0097211.1 hypothetical protein BGZ93_003206 [Podila epicladia]
MTTANAMTINSPPISHCEQQRALFNHNTQAPSPPPSPLSISSTRLGFQQDDCPTADTDYTATKESKESKESKAKNSKLQIVYETPNWLQAHLAKSKEFSADGPRTQRT